MRLIDRLTWIEVPNEPRSRPPAAIFHFVYEPRGNGPKEVGAFVHLRTNSEDVMVWRQDSETHDAFVSRVVANAANES